jgi:hypothetical protein
MLSYVATTIFCTGLVFAWVGALTSLNICNLMAAICIDGYASISAYWFLLDHDPTDMIAIVVCTLTAAMELFLWWRDGGNDDFKKKRRKLSAALKAKFRKIQAFKPKLAPSPT